MSLNMYVLSTLNILSDLKGRKEKYNIQPFSLDIKGSIMLRLTCISVFFYCLQQEDVTQQRRLIILYLPMDIVQPNMHGWG